MKLTLEADLQRERPESSAIEARSLRRVGLSSLHHVLTIGTFVAVSIGIRIPPGFDEPKLTSKMEATARVKGRSVQAAGAPTYAISLITVRQRIYRLRNFPSPLLSKRGRL